MPSSQLAERLMLSVCDALEAGSRCGRVSTASSLNLWRRVPVPAMHWCEAYVGVSHGRLPSTPGCMRATWLWESSGRDAGRREMTENQRQARTEENSRVRCQATAEVNNIQTHPRLPLSPAVIDRPSAALAAASQIHTRSYRSLTRRQTLRSDSTHRQQA